MDSLAKLLYLTGVSSEYRDYSGQLHQVPQYQRERVLGKRGINVTDRAAIERAVFDLDAAPWQRWLRPCYIVTSGQPLNVHCHPSELSASIDWSLELESGQRTSGSFTPEQQPEVGDYAIHNVRYSARQLQVGEVAPGYHWLTLSRGARVERARLIVAPQLCPQLEGGKKIWGIGTQLYTLRSERNWGIGDFTDLQALIGYAATMGADMIGLSPLHAPCSDSSDTPSPYGPSDRRFLSPLYLDPEQMPEFSLVANRLDSADVGDRLEALRNADLVDYDGVAWLKYRFFEWLYQAFLALPREAEPRERLSRFVEDQGAALEQFVTYEISHNGYADRYKTEPGFYRYLQWQCAEQLQACQNHALELGMKVGLVGDLPVGSVAHGCEVQSHPGLFMPGVTIGAPPDPLGPLGQDWGMPAMDPVALKREHYNHFITLLRTNMACVGGLRIDHAMALMRLWWCLPACGDQPRSGIYVYYPLDEMMALLRLESSRNQCLIIGEDLGVVPVEFREAMAASGLYGNRLMYFEQYRDGRFKPCREQQPDALLMTANHDVPTLSDWWQGSDLQRRRKLGLVDEREYSNQVLARQKDRHQLLQWLQQAEKLPAGLTADADQEYSESLCLAIHLACAASASQMLLLQLEDLQMMTEPVNIPGTYLEYPNWRRKQKLTLAEIFASHFSRQLLTAVNEERKRDNN